MYICPELDISDAKISHSGMAKENTVVTVTCLKHYVLLGEKEVTCQSTGWSDDPECRKCGKYLLLYAVYTCYQCTIQILVFHAEEYGNLLTIIYVDIHKMTCLYVGKSLTEK